MRRLLLVFLCAPLLSRGQTLDVTPGVNNAPITQVVYEVDGSSVVQTSEASGVEVNRDAPVIVKEVTINTGSGTKALPVFNFEGAAVRNLNITSDTTGVGVFKNGSNVDTSDLAAFEGALTGITQDADLMNYVYYDGTSGLPGDSTADYDLLFRYSLQPTDYVLVSERWGNTFFELQPLGADGELIAGANTLRFGGDGGSAYSAYDWNSGYASDSYFTFQAQAFTVVSTEKFFEGTGLTGEVYGFRIDNDGDADVKFFGLSDETFTNNPENPLVPEPSSALLILVGFVGVTMRRRR